MKPSTILWLIVAIGVVTLGATVLRDVFREEATKLVEEEGLYGALRAIGVADTELTQQLEEKLGHESGKEREIDLDHPTEVDIAFLKEVFLTGTEAGRLSAAKALVMVQEPRAVDLLARVEADEATMNLMCSGALDILRVQTRAVAAELMIDILEDRAQPANPVCAPLLEEKLQFISGRMQDLLPGFLESHRPRIRSYALRNLEPSPDSALAAKVTEMASIGGKTESALASEWLEASAQQE